MLELRAVDEGAVPTSARETSRLFVLPVATRRWVLTDNNKTVEDRKVLEDQRAMIAKRLDESLAARNKLYEANQQHHLEICNMKLQIKNLEEEKSRLQEENSKLQQQVQAAQACKYSIFFP